MTSRAIALALIVWIGMEQVGGLRASTDAAAPAIPGARSMRALGRRCPMEAPAHIDCDGDGVLDALIPAYQEGPFIHYLSPAAGAFLGLIGGMASMKAFTGNQNFTQAAALAGPDGKVLWTFKAGAMINASRILADEKRLYLASHDDILRALALGSGQVLWQQDLKGNIVGLVGSREQIIVVSAKNNITAFRSLDGTVLWQKPLKVVVMSSPDFTLLLADDTTAYASTLNNHVYALDRATGGQRWDFKTTGNPSLRLLKDGALFVAVDKALVAIETASGALRFRSEVGGWVHIAPVLDLGDRIVFQPYGDSRLLALDPRTGKTAWMVSFEGAPRDRDRKIVMPEDATIYKSSLAVQKDAEGRPRLLFVADVSSVRAVRVTDGRVLWRAPVAGTQVILLSEDRLIAVDEDRVVHSLSVTDGSARWAHEATAQVAQLERFGDRLFATLYSGDLLVLDWEDGAHASQVALGDPYRLVRSTDDRMIVCSAAGTWEYAIEGPASDAAEIPTP